MSMQKILPVIVSIFSLNVSAHSSQQPELESGFDCNTKLLRYLMKILGNWPDTNLENCWRSRLQFLFPATMMMCFVFIPQTTKLLSTENNLDTIVDVLITVDMPFMIAFVKFLAIRYYRQVFEDLIIEMRNSWRSSDIEQRREMEKHYRIGKIIVLCYTAGVVISVLINGLIRLMPLREYGLSNYSNSTFKSENLMYLTSKFFFDGGKTPIFEFIWIGQFCSGLIGGTAYVTSDAFIAILLAHLCAQFRNFHSSLKQIDFRRRDQLFASQLKSLTNQHLSYCRFMDQIERHMNKVYLLQIMMYTSTFCLQGYVLVTSENIPSTIYNTNWYSLPPKELRLLLIVMQGTSKRFQLTAGGLLEYSHKSFVKVLKSSYYYLNVLLVMKGKYELNIED
ncbi:hypothetical protein QAD02_000989 [Eretmocerus hayati]|uniref:Uncharacterized protein n=1 Tax=Eretmocerus hayati TaxID=131215 RepID=A0ACC2NEU7_9HYME|nr:hypothetical protein QAD02_000989 [Eretmocerus hayati]